MQSTAERPPDPVVTLILLRHGLTERTGSTLAGRAPGLHLDDRGTAQAKDVARRLAGIDLTAVVSSPLERCRETAHTVAAASGREVVVDDRFLECDYGDWTGRSLKDLAEEPLWRVVQAHPAAARFPGGESLAEMSNRAVAAVRDWNDHLVHTTSTGPVYLVCSHGDVIKAIVADALGLHLDQFQRLQVDPCSLTAVRYTSVRPFVLRLNDVGDGNAAALLPDPGDASGDAAVGGGAGAATEESPR
ncbi:putative phosphoglycerate mutase [Lipingzhangella halophila]|uniref:Putative phosphoglycerate mutase n=1 Tax=Lipingzhangella halophila TaxID=1783352 RepID=A0A7W7RIA6_9ACTN|nr:MSMEG_4193 family putative phosphomutase [Lipingzhangella halophila]MBB4932078.1 putative phosphoglycerate mutase [Lipingzhangella halophila]